jgi:hypothetical protein
MSTKRSLCQRKTEGGLENWICTSVEQEEIHERGPRWSWASYQMGNPELHIYHTFNEDHDLPMHVQKTMNPALNEEPVKREAKSARPTQELFPQEGGISCA